MSNDAGMSNNAKDPRSEGQSGQSEKFMELLKQLADNTTSLPAELRVAAEQLKVAAAAILGQNQGAHYKVSETL